MRARHFDGDLVRLDCASATSEIYMSLPYRHFTSNRNCCIKHPLFFVALIAFSVPTSEGKQYASYNTPYSAVQFRLSCLHAQVWGSVHFEKKLLMVLTHFGGFEGRDYRAGVTQDALRASSSMGLE